MKLFKEILVITIITIITVWLLTVLVPEQVDAKTPPKRGTIAYCLQKAPLGNKRKECVIRVIFAQVKQSQRAVAIARCESGLDPHAENGQYRGVFQMGSNERKKFGHSKTVIGQTQAALKYYRVSGWEPWACRNLV